MRRSLPRPFPWRAPLALASLLALALAVRLPLLPTTAHLPGAYSDMNVWKDWTQKIAQHGLTNIFNVSDINYIGYDYALWVIAAIYQRISPSFDIESMRLNLLVKGPPVLFDLALVALTFAVSRALLRQRPEVVAAAARRLRLDRLALAPATALALLPAALVAFHPAVVYDSAAWGQTDGIITFFMLAAVAALAGRAVMLAFFLWAVGFVVKPQPIVILPALVAFTWWMAGWRGLARAGVGIAAGAALTMGFWVVQGETRSLIHVYHMLFTPEPSLSMQAWNGWWFSTLRSHPVPDNTAVTVFGAGLTYQRASLLLFGAAVLLSLAYLRRHRDLVGLLEASAFAVFAFYMLPVSIHERYLYPLFGLLAPVLLLRPRWLLLYAPLSVTFFLNLFFVAPVTESLTGRWVDSEFTVAVAALHVLLFTLLAVIFAWASLRPRRTGRLPQPSPELLPA